MGQNRKNQPLNVAVIGAGITGISTALFLQRDGHDVTVFEPNDPAKGTSSGNAGLVSIGGCVPTSVPGILQRVPKLLLDPYGPLSIRWRYLPKLAPWLISFIRNSRPDRVEANAQAKAVLLDRAVTAYKELAQLAGTSDLLRDRGALYVYESDESFRRASFSTELMRACGRNFDYVGEDDIRQMEPALKPKYKHGLFFEDNPNILHPGQFVVRSGETFVRNGGTIVAEKVQRLTHAPNRPAVVTQNGTQTFDRIVIAAGSWTAGLLKTIGVRILLDAERGYHIMLPQPEPTLNRSVLLGDDSIFLSPMAHGLRMTSGVELGGNEAPPDYTRIRRMVKRVENAVDRVTPEEQSIWLGFRPSTPSGVPFLGPVAGRDGIFVAAGGGHIGMTLGPISGRVIADLIAGRDPGVDLTNYAVDRKAV